MTNGFKLGRKVFKKDALLIKVSESQCALTKAPINHYLLDLGCNKSHLCGVKHCKQTKQHNQLIKKES